MAGKAPVPGGLSYAAAKAAGLGLRCRVRTIAEGVTVRSRSEAVVSRQISSRFSLISWVLMRWRASPLSGP